MMLTWCSMVMVQRLMFWPGAAMMLASPTADTIFAGPGNAKPVLEQGHNGPVYDRPIYGQVMRLDSAVGPGARASSRVVLVPWDYGPMCNEVPWGNSFAWRRPGARGLYTATLRDSAHWAGGLPTYDVFVPQAEPYTNNPGGMGALGNVPDPQWLTPEELFAVARRFRTVKDTFEANAAKMALYAWADSNPQLARREPLAEGLRFIDYDQWRIRNVTLPIRGTYRVTVTVGGDSAVYFTRIDPRPDDTWDGSVYLTKSGPKTRLAPEGYTLSGAIAADTAGLAQPKQFLDGLIAKDAVDVGRTKTWKGAIRPEVPPGLGGVLAKTISELWFYVETTFAVTADGSATFEHRSQLPDGRSVVIRGVRVTQQGR
jgi:hypothetical protein